MPSAQIQQEGEGVDMCSSAQKDCNKSSNNENWAEYVLLESKQCQAHVRKYEVLSQEVQYLEELLSATS